jgi:hypothetical protein
MSILPSTDQVSLLHQQSMELCDRAMAARKDGNPDRSLELFRESLEAERKAASLVAGLFDLEPTRSILHRSAATLALDCSDFREAERLIAVALSGNPPEEIAEELRDLLEQVHFDRHLELRGIRLAPQEFQLSISGNKVGYGIVLSDEFVDRVRATEKLVLRTFERNAGRPFREAGRALKDISRNCELYLATPRAGSFAATMRVGVSERQPNLPGIDIADLPEPEQIIDNLVDCLEAFSLGDSQRLDVLIEDPSYRLNFIALADQLLPDGENVSQVGFTVTREGVPRSVSLTRRKPLRNPRETTRENGHLYVEGRLLFADATSAEKNQIRVVDDDSVTHKFLVPEGLMADIIKPLWEDRVAIHSVRSKGGKRYRLERIERAPSKES